MAKDSIVDFEHICICLLGCTNYAVLFAVLNDQRPSCAIGMRSTLRCVVFFSFLFPLSTNSTKWSNTLKRIVWVYLTSLWVDT